MDRIEEALEELSAVHSWLDALPLTMVRTAFRRQTLAIDLLRAELVARPACLPCPSAVLTSTSNSALHAAAAASRVGHGCDYEWEHRGEIFRCNYPPGAGTTRCALHPVPTPEGR